MTLSIDTYAYVDSAALFAGVAHLPWAVFLDSGVVADNKTTTEQGRYDVLAIKPRVTLVTRAQSTVITEGDFTTVSNQNPLSLIKAKLAEVNFAPVTDSKVECPYMPGAIGYFSYDLARRFERLPNQAKDDQKLPEMAIGIYDALVVVDHRNKHTQIIARGLPPVGLLVQEWRELIENCLKGASTRWRSVTRPKFENKHIQDDLSESEYRARFDAIRAYTVAGECYQVNLARHFNMVAPDDAWQTYVRLRSASPAPYGCYFNLPFAKILSNSPESFIQCEDRRVTTSPIKGTVSRDHLNAENDRIIAGKLASSAKDQAENLMIVDLMRNDLSRCCELGSVKVAKLFALHSFANVHHLISTVVGTLRQDLHALDLLQSCFPGGSITGAPKIRAMQIIEELEPLRRGLYCGSVGHIGVNGSLQTNICIRTIVIKQGIARFAAGGGLVIDSQLDEEYQEIKDKASMMIAALTGK